MSQGQDTAKKARFEAGMVTFRSQRGQLYREYCAANEALYEGYSDKLRAGLKPVNEVYFRECDPIWRAIFGDAFREEFEHHVGKRPAPPQQRDQTKRAQLEAGVKTFRSNKAQSFAKLEAGHRAVRSRLDRERDAEEKRIRDTFKRKRDAAWTGIFGNEFPQEFRHEQANWMAD